MRPAAAFRSALLVSESAVAHFRDGNRRSVSRGGFHGSHPEPLLPPERDWIRRASGKRSRADAVLGYDASEAESTAVRRPGKDPQLGKGFDGKCNRLGWRSGTHLRQRGNDGSTR